MPDTSTPNAIQSPVLSVQNLLTNPHSIAGWLAMASAVTGWASGIVTESSTAMIMDAGVMALGIFNVLMPAIIKHK